MAHLDIGIDLDGVCSQFEEELRYFAIHYKNHHPSDVASGGVGDPDTVWDFPIRMWGWSPEQFLSYCDEAVDAGILHLHYDPYPGVVEMIDRFHNQGHSIHIITSRNFGTKSTHNTSDWLRKHGIEYDSLIFTKKKEIIDIDLHLDDHLANWKAMVDAGKECYILDRPWNRETYIGPWRVMNYREFEEVVNDYAGR